MCIRDRFTLDGEANVLNYRIVHTVIRSDRRYCYAEVQQLLEDNGVVDGTGCLLYTSRPSQWFSSISQ